MSLPRETEICVVVSRFAQTTVAPLVRSMDDSKIMDKSVIDILFEQGVLVTFLDCSSLLLTSSSWGLRFQQSMVAQYIFLEHKITFTLEASFLSAIVVVEELAKVVPCVLQFSFLFLSRLMHQLVSAVTCKIHW